ncbi:MAG: sensor histidine kinase, partial [Exilispira sp.]
NNIKTPLIIDIVEILYNINQNQNIKKSLMIQGIIFSKIYNLIIPENYNINPKKEIYQKYIIDYLTSQSFQKEFSTFKNTVNNTGIHFFSLLDQNNSIFISFIASNSQAYTVIYSFNLLYLSSLMIDNMKTYDFKFSLNIDEFTREIEAYTLFKIMDIGIGTYRKLYLALYVRNSELLGYLSQKRYRITNLAFFILVLFIFLTIIILVTFTLKEFSLNKLKSDFVSIVSHELKTPITAIQLMLETIIDRYTSLNDDKKLDYLTNIFKETERLLFLINNLLIYSRNEKNKQLISISTVNICQILKDVVEFFKIDKKSMKIDIDFPENNIIIEADGLSLKQVFYNLIDNAYKYSKENKYLKITVLDEKNIIKIKFKDNGIGISSNELPYIFEKFYRGNETNFIPGTGLGLSLTKSIVEMHQGKITVASNPGAGTEFTIILPKKQRNIKRRITNESKENLTG